MDGSAPLSGLLVQLIKDADTAIQGQTDEAGFFELTDIPPGDYLLNVVDYVSLRQGRMRMRHEGIWIESGKTHQVELIFGDGFQVTGTVQGLPAEMPDRIIIIRRPGGLAPEDIPPTDKNVQIEAAKFLVASSRIDDNNEYVIEDLTPGTYFFEILKNPFKGESIPEFEIRDRTPYYRAEITIGTQDIQHDVTVE